MTETEIRWSTTSPSQWGRVLAFQIPRARYAAVREEIARDLRKRVVRPGFRKGHVPAALVERDFGDRIQTGTLEKIIPEACDRAIREDQLDGLNEPRVQKLDLDDPEVVKFEVVLEIRPTITLQPLEGLRGTRWKPAVADEQVARTLDDVRDQQAQFADVDREARDGDYVLVSYVPLDGEGNERTSQKVENYPFQLGAAGAVPEFEQAARGRRAGETTTVAIEYPADTKNPEWAGQRVDFHVTVQAVKEKRLPEADDDLARELGLQSLDELRERLRGDLQRRLEEESEKDLRESLVEHLLGQNVFEAPASMVEQYLEAVRHDWEERGRRAHVPPPTDEQRAEFDRAARPTAERFVRRGLLLDQIGREHGIDVQEEDVDKWIEERVQAGGSGAEDVRKFFADVRRRRRLKHDLAEEKIFDFLKTQAQIAEVERSAVHPGAGAQ